MSKSVLIRVLVCGLFAGSSMLVWAQEKNTESSQSGEQAGNQKSATAEETLVWRSFDVPETQVTVLMPGEPKKFERNLNLLSQDLPVAIKGYRMVFKNGQALVSISYSDLLNEMADTNARRKALQAAEKKTIAAVLAGAPKKSEEIKILNYPAREFVYDFAYTDPKSSQAIRWTAHNTYLIIGQRFFRLSVIQYTDDYNEQLAKKFLDSFKLNKQKKSANSSGKQVPEGAQ